MRAALALLLAIACTPLFAQDAEMLAGAQREKKAVVIFYRANPCARCDEFVRDTLVHPAIARRLANVVFAVMDAPDHGDPHLALYDRTGTLRARWPMVPDTTNFGIILDSASAAAPHLERALQSSESGAVAAADYETGFALALLGQTTAARAALVRAREAGSEPAVALLAQLDGTAAKEATEPTATMIRILPLYRQVISGRQFVRTQVSSAAVARVVFSVDDRDVATITKPPFAATLDLGATPEHHAIRVTAFDRAGHSLGRDERIVNEGGETFWLRLVSPRDGSAGGATTVSMNVRTPAARRIRRVVVSWNDAERAVLATPPWDATINIPSEQLGVLRAVAELDDGRTSEDAVLLNASGASGRADVQLVQLPITLDDANAAVAADRITVREGTRVRNVESIATAAETPLTVGLLFDVSSSMQKTLPDLQEAAVRFLDAVLGERDRAFFITFDTSAKLTQPATNDRALLRRQIMRVRPDGLTALHDAMVLGLLQFEGVKGRRALIVFTDGVDRTSAYRASDVSEVARRVSVPIHVIATPAWSLTTMAADPRASAAGSWISDPPSEELQRVARATGGSLHIISTLRELPAVYAEIEAALRAQLLAFIRTDPATRENDWRSVTVTIDGGKTKVFAPEGYYAGW
ncbi:MAG TPA: VWA domain-containing protein [Thermoanaerobaculia bacterium]|nr:VWA domain-containing protein [Thermoanaerobaculia bacterium]